MKFGQTLIPGTLVRRYKRFLADVELDDGTVITCHCPNTGSMLGCQAPGSRVWLSRSENPRRKYAMTWELVELPGKGLVGIHTGRSNRLVQEALSANCLPTLGGYGRIQPEVTLRELNTRMDFLLADGGERPDCYLEVKNVTAAVDDGIALFPDAVSTRGTRHLRVLRRQAAQGFRAALVFCVQRTDVEEVRPADDIDPDYGSELRAAMADGVEVHALRARINTNCIRLADALPVVCP